MNSNNLAKVAKGGVLFGAGSLSANLIQFIFGIMIIRVMPADAFGVISLANTLVSVCVVISVLGFQNGLSRFVSLNKANNQGKTISLYAGSGLLVSLTLAVLFSLILFFGGDQLELLFSMPLLSNVLTYFSFMIVPLSLMLVFNSLFRGVGNAKAKVVYQDLSLNFNKLIFLVCVSSFFVYQFENMLWIYVASAYVTFLLYSAYTFRLFIKKYGLDFDYQIAKKLVFFSVPLFGVALSANIVNWAGVFGLGYFGEAHEVAYFSAIQRAAQILTIPLLAVGFLYLPVATELIGKGKHADVRGLYVGLTKWISILTIPVFLYLFIDSDFFLTQLFGDEYRNLGAALKVMILGSFVHILVGPNSMTMIAFGDTKIVFIGAVIASLVSVVGSMLLIPEFGVIGAASSISIARIISNFYISWKMNSQYSIHVFDNTFIKPIIFSLILNVFILWLSSEYKPIGELTYVATIPFMFAITILVPYFCGSVTNEDREIFRSIKSRLLR